METGPGSRSLLAATLIGSGATVVVGIFGVLRTKVLALELGPAGLGLYGQVLVLLAALSAVSGLGLGLGTTRAVAEYRAKGDLEKVKRVLEVSFALPLAVALALGLVIVAVSGPLTPLLLDADRTLLIVLAGIAVPLVALQGPLVHALQGFRDVVGAQGSNVFFGIALTVASAIGVLIAGLDGAVVGLLAGNLAYVAILGWRLRRQARGAGIGIRLSSGLRRRHLKDPAVRAVLAIGFASLFVGVIAGAGELVVRTIVLRSQGAADAGIFQALQLISTQLFGVVVTSVVFLSFTQITEAHAAADSTAVQRSIDDTLRLALLLTLPVLLVFALFREDIVRLFLSSGFGEAVGLLPRQLTGDAFRTVAWALGAALVPVGLTRVWVGLSLLVILGYVFAAALLVPAFGLDGAVDAYVVQWGTAAIVSVWIFARRRLFAPSALTWRTLGAGAGACALMLTLPQPTWIVATTIAVVFALLLFALGTGADERAALRSRVRRSTH